MLEDILREILFAKPLVDDLSHKAHTLDKKIVSMCSIMTHHAKTGDYDSMRRIYEACSDMVDRRFDIEADLEYYKSITYPSLSKGAA